MRILLFLLVLVIASCNPLKKAVRVMKENPEKLAELCAETFPGGDTVFIKGDTTIKVDTVTEGVIIEVPCDTATLTAKCPPAKVITRAVTIHDTLIKPDVYKEAKLNYTIQARDKTIADQAIAINRIQSDFDKMKDKRNWWRIVALILSGMLGLGILAKFKGWF